MMIDEIFRTSDVVLDLRARDKVAAIEEVLGQLRGDERVTNWERLRAAIVERDAPAVEQGEVAICIAHGRTDAVNGLVVAAGRSADGLVFPEVGTPVRLVFVVGIPSAMSSEYLRIVGAIVRVCRDPRSFGDLLAADSGAGFVESLAVAAERL